MPVGKPRMTQRDKWAKRPPVMRYRAFCDLLRACVGNAKLPHALRLTFELPMPKSWSQQKKDAMRGMPHQQKPDLDNLAKAVGDALYGNDAVIHELHARKVWADEGRVTLEAL